MTTNDDQDNGGWETLKSKKGDQDFVYKEEDLQKDDISGDDAEDGLEVIVEDEVEKKPSAVEKTKKEGGRAEKRIRQLAREKNDYASKLSEAQKEIADLKRGTISVQRSQAETSLSQYETLISARKSELKQAKLNGDVDKEMEIEDALRDLTISKRIAEANKEKFAKQEKDIAPKEEEKNTNTTNSQPGKQQQQQQELPERLQDWMADNPWFEKNRKMQVYSATVADELLAEGLTFEDEEFYEKIDKEIRDRFPEQFEDNEEFVSSGDDVVQSKNKTNKQPASNTEDVKRRQVVPGSSRTPVVKKGREVLTREEAATADRLGIPRERYAARKKADRESREGSGWVTIGRAK